MASDTAVCRTKEDGLGFREALEKVDMWLFVDNFPRIVGLRRENLRSRSYLLQMKAIHNGAKTRV
jgi:hypothetical protein